MTYIKIIEKYPIPFERESVIDMQVKSVDGPFGLRSYADVITSVDGFHERYIEEMIRTDEWSVFQNHWGVSNYIYFWNYQLGYGFKANATWETMCGLVDMMDKFTEEYSVEDFEPAYYPWQLP